MTFAISAFEALKSDLEALDSLSPPSLATLQARARIADLECLMLEARRRLRERSAADSEIERKAVNTAIALSEKYGGKSIAELRQIVKDCG